MLNNLTNIKYINNLFELDNYLKKINTKNYNLVNYFWIEYGFYPIFFNELFREFFTTLEGKYIGICFEGQELVYEDKVDYLLVLKNFIDTKKTYNNNQETDLLINNFKNISDRGIAFWYTLRNFNEDEYWNIIKNYKFKNMIFPIGKDQPWKLGLHSLKQFCYADGEKKMYTSEDTLWRTSGTLGWNLDYWKIDYDFENILKYKKKDYYCIFVKNTWKTRDFRSENINDILVGKNGISGKEGFGFVNYEFLIKLINFLLEMNKKIVIINDLVKYPIPKNKNIFEFNMIGYFDIKKFCSVVHNSKIFLTSSTSPLDLAAYYCNTNIVCLDDIQNKYNWVQKVLNLKNKKAIAFDMKYDNFEILKKFLNTN